MAILNKAEMPHTRPQIDLSGPAGNVFNLMGLVKIYGRQLSLTPQEIFIIQEEMMSDEYDHAVAVFDLNFGRFVDLVK